MASRFGNKLFEQEDLALLSSGISGYLKYHR
jgi:hypothetical protein